MDTINGFEVNTDTRIVLKSNRMFDDDQVRLSTIYHHFLKSTNGNEGANGVVKSLLSNMHREVSPIFPSENFGSREPKAEATTFGYGKEAVCEVERRPRDGQERLYCDKAGETVVETPTNEACDSSGMERVSDESRRVSGARPNQEEESASNVEEREAGNKEKRELIGTIERIFSPEELPRGFRKWSEEEKYAWIVERGSIELLELPKSLSNTIPSIMRPGDCGRSPSEKPKWLDLEKFRRGQRFATEHAFGLYFANMISLFILFTPRDALRPMIISGKSGTPYLAFKRYLSTVRRVRNWYRSDPWTQGTAAYKDMQAVRKMHLSMRQQLCEMNNEEIDTASRIQDTWCPMRSALLEDFRAACFPKEGDKCLLKKWENSPFRPKPLNQGEMAATQFAFMGLAILHPEYFAIHYATEEDLDSFCYLWRCIGYMLGMEDRYNFCRGSLAEIKQRSRDIIESYLKPNLRDITSEWEHMTRCLVEGINYYFPGAVYSSAVLYLCQLINVPLPRYRAAVGFTAILYMEYQKLVLRYLTKWRTLKRLLNKLVDYAIDAALRLDPKSHVRLEQKSASALSESPLY